MGVHLGNDPGGDQVVLNAKHHFKQSRVLFIFGVKIFEKDRT
jgi:hypothetical protein